MRQVLSRDSLLLSDLDGTVLPLLHDPKMRRIEPMAFQAFSQFNDAFPNQVLPVTGRDWGQVVDCFGGSVPSFPVISSNGAQLNLANGQEVLFDFSPEETLFIAEMRKYMGAFKMIHPELVAEVKRFEIGFHSSPSSGYEDMSPDSIRYAADTCAAVLERLEAKATSLSLNFSIAGTEVTHREMSCRRVNKLTSMHAFSQYLDTLPRSDDWRHVLYFGDCFLKGNDREIAIAVKKRGGAIIQVTNQVPDRIPSPDDPAYPDYIFATPAELGGWLLAQVNQLVARPSFAKKSCSNPAIPQVQ
jgi:hydroxymethylpyrimidine pyrophosphatase-like HAD family hydrolase